MMVFVNDPKNLKALGRNPFTIANTLTMTVITTAAVVELNEGFDIPTLRYQPAPMRVTDNEQPDHEWLVNAWVEVDRLSYKRWEDGVLSEWRNA